MDLDTVAEASLRENLQISPPGSPLFFSSYLDALLEPGADLIWREGGLGRSVEMKRAFSGLFGRFFARAYLTEYHDFRWFAAINGNPFQLSLRWRVAKKSTSKSEMPDWICAGPGVLAIAEAKGSHLTGKFRGIAIPGPIRTANEQITGVVVQKLVGRSWINIGLKGWAVMSRWGTSVPAKTPLLYVLDPKTDGAEPLGDDADDLAQAIARASVQQTAEGLGLLDSSLPMLRDMTRSVSVVGDDQKRRFIGIFMTPMGPLNVAVDEARRLAARLPDASSIRFIGMPAELLDDFHDGRPIPDFMPDKIGQSALQGRDGLLSASVMEIDDAS